MRSFNPFRWLNRSFIIDVLTYTGLGVTLWRYAWQKQIRALLGYAIGLGFFLLCVLWALLFAGWACVLALSDWLHSQVWALVITALMYLVLGYLGWRLSLRCARKGILQRMFCNTPRRNNLRHLKKGLD